MGVGSVAMRTSGTRRRCSPISVGGLTTTPPRRRLTLQRLRRRRRICARTRDCLRAAIWVPPENGGGSPGEPLIEAPHLSRRLGSTPDHSAGPYQNQVVSKTPRTHP